MNIIYTCDNNYIWLQGISMISLYENNKMMDELNVFLLGENISEENKGILRDISEKYNRHITIIDVPHLDIPDSLVSDRWPLSAFTRLYAHALLPADIKKVLYLDCDTIINGDISELDHVDFQDNIVMGVKDCIGKEYRVNIGLRADEVYINAGVLLLNLEKMRKLNMKKRIDHFMRRYEKRINYADQDILNGIFKGRKGAIAPKYNVMTIDFMYSHKEIVTLRKPVNFYDENELKTAIVDPRIIHYTTNMRTIRPWYSNTNHPYAFRFMEYKMLSPWKEKELSNMKFKTETYKVIYVINLFPKKVSQFLLGFIHSKLQPLYIRIRAR